MELQETFSREKSSWKFWKDKESQATPCNFILKIVSNMDVFLLVLNFLFW